MKLIRSLVFPWILFFVLAVTGMAVVGVEFPHLQPTLHVVTYALLGLGSLLCIMSNVNSLTGVGLWMAEALPESIRYSSSRWILRAIKASLVAGAFWFVGQLPWIPFIWKAAVIPAVFTITLFVGIWSLMGPILKLASNLPWSRVFSVIFSVPLLASVPFTALIVGEMIVESYRASQPELGIAAEKAVAQPEKLTLVGRVLSITSTEMRVFTQWPPGSEETQTVEIDLTQLSPRLASDLPKSPTENEIQLTVLRRAVREAAVQTHPDQLNEKEVLSRLKSTKPETRAQAFRQIYESPKFCDQFTKEIQAALAPKGAKDVVYWAVKASDCASIRTVIALPRLAQIMLEHPDAQVRAAAIRGFKKYGNENIRQIAYLLVKRISENEPSEVIEATASILAPLGADEQRWSTNRLKSLLDSPNVSAAAAKVLVHNYGRADLVSEYVAQNLGGAEDARERAVHMICLLPKSKRTVAEPKVNDIVAMIKSGDRNDPGLKALDCLGKVGFNAIREEVSKPSQLDRPLAARALAELDVEDAAPEVIEVADACARDENPQVRKWCSQSLGQLGAPALPKILDLLSSNDASLKDAGRTALNYFEDPTAKNELLQIMEDNSGWMANNKKLEIAKSIRTALSKIEGSEHAQAPSP